MLSTSLRRQTYTMRDIEFPAVCRVRGATTGLSFSILASGREDLRAPVGSQQLLACVAAQG